MTSSKTVPLVDSEEPREAASRSEAHQTTSEHLYNALWAVTEVTAHSAL